MKYLVCIDGSKESEKAISLCYRLVQEKDEVTVYGAYRKISHFGIETVDTEMLHALDVYHSRQEKARRAPIIQFLEEAKLKIQKKVKDTVQIFIEEVDDVRESIVAFAKRNEIDVIVLGTKGKNQLKLIRLGSISTYVIQNSHCSVLVAR